MDLFFLVFLVVGIKPKWNANFFQQKRNYLNGQGDIDNIGGKMISNCKIFFGYIQRFIQEKNEKIFLSLF